MIKIYIPQPLLSFTDNKAQVQAEGNTLDELLHDLDRQFAGLRLRIIDEHDAIRPSVKFFVNGEPVRTLSAVLVQGDAVQISQPPA